MTLSGWVTAYNISTYFYLAPIYLEHVSKTMKDPPIHGLVGRFRRQCLYIILVDPVHHSLSVYTFYRKYSDQNTNIRFWAARQLWLAHVGPWLNFHVRAIWPISWVNVTIIFNRRIAIRMKLMVRRTRAKWTLHQGLDWTDEGSHALDAQKFELHLIGATSPIMLGRPDCRNDHCLLEWLEGQMSSWVYLNH
jgi:hypothetical protein